MLARLGVFIFALSYVKCQKVVTQTPVSHTVNKGDTATFMCNVVRDDDASANWYKQIPGGVPQYVLRHYNSWSTPKYGSGFSSPKFTSTSSSKIDYNLIINNVEVEDSAVYYCQTYDSTAKEYVSQ
ncbi:hypothetical protein PHYPO_G00044140 [Pangasianodon hypophthalmus]|uniref:Ig-like domain-containing protein n=1 Tax=Pangasianodon hypophthalmus TaxID=310915 RepID=A0A5N5MFF8_PANHP|nr:hypothetical protein PHYPO_G00044140 [Pangasianodon hypophthalmus]